MAFAKVRPVPEEYALNAVIYARYSSDKQTENSIDFQLRNDRAYCEAKGLRVVGEYIDRAISGTSDQRPEFQRMIRDSKKQHFAFIVVYRFDRFARNRYDSAIYKKELETVGVRVLSTEESVGNGDEGLILESIYEAMAESYSRRLSRVVSQGMKETARKGQSTGGNLSHGYVVKDHMLAIDEKIAPAIRYAFESRANGKKKSPIVNELNERGYRTKTGKPYTIQALTRILNNPIYKGDNSYAGIERSCPAIVSAELWDKVQKIEETERKQYGSRATETFFTLSGKVFCGYCGMTMIGDSGKSHDGTKHSYYACSGKKNRKNDCKKKSEKKDFLEWYICEQTSLILTDENVKKLAQCVYEASEDSIGTQRIAELKRTLAGIERDLDDAANALIKTNSPALLKRINEKVATLEARQATTQSELARLQIDQELRISRDEIEAYLKSFRGGDLMNEEYRYRLIKTFVNCIYLYDNKIVIYYNAPHMKEISYIEMLNDATDSSNCSDSLTDGPPSIKLSEHACLVFKRGGFGLFVFWDNNPEFDRLKHNFRRRRNAQQFPSNLSCEQLLRPPLSVQSCSAPDEPEAFISFLSERAPPVR